MSTKPVIFLAFANDRVDDAAYLRNLPRELHGIREALEQAVKAGLCEVVERANATIESILDVFQDNRYRDRIAIFHYGGHANGYQLLLENLDGSHASAHSDGLASFLAKQLGLQLIFLNGCSSQQQALDLVDSGVPAVIGTSQSINDDVATLLALRFYQALGNGTSLARAWDEAVDQAKIQKGTSNMRDLFWEGLEDEDSVADRFPWDIYYMKGAERVRGWNLPESADNPMFGLPEPNQLDLPEQPYRFLQRYTRVQAPIFFGRSYYIRDLYKSATDPMAAPIILFYGQSGVGKSSLLDAGLFPRLERTAQVVYVRRDKQKGLLGTFREALGYEDRGESLQRQHQTKNESNLVQRIAQLKLIEEQSEEDEKPELQRFIHTLEQKLKAQQSGQKQEGILISDDHTLREAWHLLEQRYEAPLIILLDQVEELYTRPNAALNDELDDFLDEVKDIFGQADKRPMGKLILSYRKEYHPEIKEACVARNLPKEEVFLKALNRKDIIEVVKGLSLTERLQRNYRLEVEEDLPVIIADDLLEDKDSPIAPVLQILLTKMWRMAENEEYRFFSVNRYQELRKKGILMDDFFNEQMEQLEKAFPNEANSGLALGLLQLHITKVGTAGSRSVDELRGLYSDRQEVIDRLVEKLKDLFLLSSTSNDATGLAHDTLAPLVLQAYRSSNRPAQRGAIILDSKMLAYRQDKENVIDPEDLRIVEEGAYGMPLLTQKEQELIDKSRRRRDRAILRERIIKVMGIVAGLVIIGTAVFAVRQMLDAKESEKRALKERAKAKAAAVEAQRSDSLARSQSILAREQKEQALIAKREAELARNKALESDSLAQKDKVAAILAKNTADSLLLRALQSDSLAKKDREEARRQAEQARLASERAEAEKERAEYQYLMSSANERAVQSLLIKDDKRTKALLAMESYDLGKKAAMNVPEGMSQLNSAKVFESLNHAFLAFVDDELHKAEIWDLNLAQDQLFFGDKSGQLYTAKLLEANSWEMPRLHAQPLGDDRLLQVKVSATCRRGQNEFLIGLSNRQVWKIGGSNPQLLYAAEKPIGAIAYMEPQGWLFLAMGGNKLLIWSEPDQKAIWSLDAEAEIAALAVDEQRQWVFAADKQGYISYWNLQQPNPEQYILNPGSSSAQLTAIAYHQLEGFLVAGSSDGNIYGIDMNGDRAVRLFTGRHKGVVTALGFHEKSGFLGSAGLDGQLLSWKLRENQDLQSLARQVPALVFEGSKVLALGYSESGDYLLFTDLEGLKARVMNSQMLYDKLKEHTKGEAWEKEDAVSE